MSNTIRPSQVMADITNRLSRLGEATGGKTYTFKVEPHGRDNWDVRARVTVNYEGVERDMFLTLTDIPA